MGEEFYLRIGDAERGPYTLSQIRHLYTVGFIKGNTEYRQEGAELWREVETLCRPPSGLLWQRWVSPATAIMAAAVVFVLVALFEPVLSIGWKESYQSAYTPESAYWKARGYVRQATKPHTTILRFAPFNEAEVQSLGQSSGQVLLHTAPDIEPARTWNVSLQFEPAKARWLLLELREQR